MCACIKCLCACFEALGAAPLAYLTEALPTHASIDGAKVIRNKILVTIFHFSKQINKIINKIVSTIGLTMEIPITRLAVQLQDLLIQGSQRVVQSSNRALYD